MSLTPPTAAEVKAFRQAIGATQAQLADMLGVSKRAIETWEGGDREAPAMLRLALGALNANTPPWQSLPALRDLPTLYAERRALLAEMAELEPNTQAETIAAWQERLRRIDNEIAHVQGVVGPALR